MSKYKILLILVFLALAMLAAILFLLYQSQQNVTKSTSTTKATVGNLEFQIISEIPNLKIKPESIKTEQLKEYLTQMNLWPLENVPALGAARTITPAKIKIVLKPQENFLADASLNQSLRIKRIYEELDTEGRPLTSYLQGELSVDGKILTLTMYTDPDFSKRTIYSPEKFLTRNILFEIFLNFQSVPNSQRASQEFQEAIPTVDNYLFEIEEMPRTFIEKFIGHIIKEVNAQSSGQCQGTITCGTFVSQRSCSGNPSIICIDDTDCFGVGTCQITSSCRYDGSYGSAGNCLLLGVGPSCTTSCGSSCSQGTCTYNPGAATCTPNGYKPSEFGGAVCCSGCQDPPTKICQACGSIPPPPSCGNGVCGGGEDCIKCPADCGACPPGPPPSPTCAICRPQAANCGVYGLADNPGGGSCPAGQMCCGNVAGDPRNPGCTWRAINGPSSVVAGGSVTWNAYADSWDFDITGFTAQSFNPGVANPDRVGYGANSGCGDYGFGGPGNPCWWIDKAVPSPRITASAAAPPGSVAIIRFEATNTAGGKCSGTKAISVTSIGPWWQAIQGDVTATGDLKSLIPLSTCTLPTCNPLFIRNTSPNFPGVATYGGTAFDFADTASDGRGNVSSKRWLANSLYQGRIFDYSYFERQIPDDITLNEIDNGNANCSQGVSCSVTGGFFNSGGTPSRGFVWYHFNGETWGDLEINNVNLVGSRKVLLLVDGGDIKIKGRINLQNKGLGFFMAMAGKRPDGTRGNIRVDASVKDTGGNPGLEGIYMADASFYTGTTGTKTDDKLTIHGSVAAWNGIFLQRDLGSAKNTNTPAEVFEYAPELVLTFPREFTRDRLIWREVAP